MLAFFRWFCHPNYLEDLEGDLRERFGKRLEERGIRSAKRLFTLDVLGLFRPGLIRSFPRTLNIFDRDMFKNHLKIGFRNLLKHRVFTLINIGGMTIGMVCFILISLYIQYELSYDGHHEKADRIYRVSQIQKGNNFRGTDRFALAPQPLAPALKEHFPEVEAATTLQVREALFSHGEQTFYERGLFADEHLFEVFTYPIKEGMGKEALQNPNTVILTESLAKKYFGEDSPIGKTLHFENNRPLTVKGIVWDFPKNQHFDFDYITSFQNLPWYKDDVGRWGSNNYRAYMVLTEGYEYKELEAKLGLLGTYYKDSFKPIFFLQPLRDIHLRSQINFEISANSDIRYIYLSAFIALVILLLASINYMNLASARSAGRSKEVGMRKVLGAKRTQLVNQFMVESILITFFSFGLAMGSVYFLLPVFNQLIDQQVSLDLKGNRTVFGIMLSIAIILAGLSGLYPAILSSTINPIKALKGGWFKKGKDGAFLRNILVVGQFTAAIVLAIASVVIHQQLEYIQNKKLGYTRDQVVYVPYRQADFYERRDALKAELLKHPQIEKVSFASSLPLNMQSQGVVDTWEGNGGEEKLWIYRNYIDHDFIDLFEMSLVEGRNYSPEHPTDSTVSIILNESAVKALGWESAIGKTFDNKQVIGVVEDFHFQPFNLAIEPMFLSLGTERRSAYGNIVIKTTMKDWDNSLAHVQRTLKTFLPKVPIEHRFMDESYNQLYRSEKRFGEVFNIFTCIALFIASIGLFGLVAHSILLRTKEIGIRKVLGATVSNILGLVSKSFLRLVLLSAIIAVPIAWLGMDRWLEDFAYRIHLDWWIFLSVGSLALIIAFFTANAQTIKVANRNPVHALREE
ncbi:ABC transporter permease [Muricauda sp. SCSIO 64092]|uniref:ABC transporter permease n=1 Tax=Allomuricauda sp. SCSIO 64092 TaxID=2908842 RepID=UPI001FF518F0|nr:ABC transporter permease [Muricauda sp. SCSIO 64092]UOY08070.1 ABC transporter permease [Muricauda sp. SCSIO 64092]